MTNKYVERLEDSQTTWMMRARDFEREIALLKAQKAKLLEALIDLREEMLRYRWDTEGPPTTSYRKTMENAQAAIDAETEDKSHE